MQSCAGSVNSSVRWQKAIAVGLGVLLLFLLSATLFAQSTGTLTGTVYDQTGAVVPNAKVSLINQSTGDKRDTLSNDTGFFSFGTVQPGTYTVRVEAANFKAWQNKGVSILPGDVRNLGQVQLQVGVSTDSVTVESTGEIVPTDSGELSHTLTSAQIDHLSLEGRDATELIRTLPGFAIFRSNVTNTAQDFTTISPTGGAVGQGYVGGGAPYRGGTDLISDGAHIIDNGCNCGATQTVNGDMVSEVKVQTSNFGADSAKGPVVVNAVGKSGTTDYHGEIYLHARDSSLNSLDYSFKKQLLGDTLGLIKKPGDRYMFPGANFGGPVPGTNKKLIFWTGFEYYYQSNFPMQGLSAPGLQELQVPTMSQRAGDFDPASGDNPEFCAIYCGSLTYYDPNLGANVSGMTVSSAAIDPGGAILLANLPAPNANPAATGGSNLLVPQNLDQNGWMFRTRVDYNLSDASKLYVSYNTQKETDSSPIHLWWTPPNSIPFPGGMSAKDNSQTISGHFLHTFSPSLTNDFASGLAYINYPLVRNDPNAWGLQANSYPYHGVFPTNTSMMPSISNGYWIAGVPFMDQADIFEPSGSFVWKKWNLSFEDNLTKSYKTHTIKAGFYYERTVNDQGSFSYINGEATFTPFGPFTCGNAGLGIPTVSCGSDNPYANMLLGATNGYSEWNQSPLDNLWYPTLSFFVQDDWKVTRRLTLNLGLRADHLGAWTPSDSPQGVAAFTGDLGSGTNLPGFDWNGNNPKIPAAGRDVSLITWEPRLGLAFDIFGTGKTVLRGGWGEYGYRDQWNDYANAVETANGVRKWGAPGPFTLSQLSALGDLGGATGGLPSSGFGVDINDHDQPLTRSYNFTIDQRMPWNTVLQVGYVGSQTVHQPLEGDDPRSLQNLNFVPMGGAFAPGAANDGPNAGLYNGGAGCPAPPCDLGTVQNSAYPFGANYQANTVKVLRHLGESNYNAFQVSFLRQKGRINYNLNYTWSKALGTLGTQQLNGLAPDGTNIKNDYGVLDIDRSHIINLSYVFQGGNFIKGNKILAGILNGWNLSGITGWQSGPNLQTLTSSNFFLTGNGPIDPVTGRAIPINATNYAGSPNMNLQPTITCDPTSNLGPHQFVNGSCFGIAPGGEQGAFQFPYIHGPAFINSDLAVYKTFKVTERQAVEFRLSAFNFLNHPLDSFDPNQNGDLTLNMVYNASTGKYDQTNPAFGITPTKYGRRVLELSAKFTF